jgi:hypothetical protein
VIGLMAAAALVPFIAIESKKPITILNGDMHLIVEELIDKVFAAFHRLIVPQVVANINRVVSKKDTNKSLATNNEQKKIENGKTKSN